MVSIIPYEHNFIKEIKLADELIDYIIKFSNMSFNLVVVKDYIGISIYDINDKKLLKKIDTFQLKHMSVSKCGKFVVGSNYYHVCIWNIKSSLMIQSIDVDFVPILDCYNICSYSNGEPVHTFTINNELLIACNDKITKYHLVDNIWIDEAIYQLPSNTHITCISANLSTNTFAVGDLNGNVYIYNCDTIDLVHKFSTKLPGLNRTDLYPEITSISFNKHLIVVSSNSMNNILFNLNTMTLKRINSHDNMCMHFLTHLLLTPCLTKFIGSSYRTNKTYMWDANTGDYIKTLDIFVDTDSIFTLDGNKLISYDWRDGLQIFDWE